MMYFSYYQMRLTLNFDILYTFKKNIFFFFFTSLALQKENLSLFLSAMLGL